MERYRRLRGDKSKYSNVRISCIVVISIGITIKERYENIYG